MAPPLYLHNGYTFKVPIALVGMGKTVLGRACATLPTATAMPPKIGDCEATMAALGKYYTGALSAAALLAACGPLNERAVHITLSDGGPFNACKTCTVHAVRPFL